MKTFKNYIDESHQIKLNGKSVNITLPYRSKEDKLVIINTAKFDTAFKKDKDFYIGKGGAGSIKGRYKGFELFALGGKEELVPGVSIDHSPTNSIEASEVDVDKDGNVSFTNGRHRYAWMRDHGIKDIYVAMNKQSIENAKRHGLIK
jgi:hypothetical protein